MKDMPGCMMPDGGECCESYIRRLADIERLQALANELGGSLQFILAFYEPGQRHLDTNAWKQAEASGRAAHAKWLALKDGSK